MIGEERRKWLQRIRRRIAENNGIVYMKAEKHEKDCNGDCPVCRAEARYIDSELSRKARMGEEVRLSSILSELLMDVDLTIGVCGVNKVTEKKTQPSIIYIESVSDGSKRGKAQSEKSQKKNIPSNEINKIEAVMIEELELTIHLDSALKSYGIKDTDDLYVMLKGDAMNMKKKLRGGYKYLVERLKELGYEITEEMG